MQILSRWTAMLFSKNILMCSVAPRNIIVLIYHTRRYPCRTTLLERFHPSIGMRSRGLERSGRNGGRPMARMLAKKKVLNDCCLHQIIIIPTEALSSVFFPNSRKEQSEGSVSKGITALTTLIPHTGISNGTTLCRYVPFLPSLFRYPWERSALWTTTLSSHHCTLYL